MPLHPHQHAALCQELRRPEYAGLSADDAYTLLSRRENGRATEAEKRLSRLVFLERSRWEAMPVKHRPVHVFLVEDGTLSGFRLGVPGFPNRVRRDEFNPAWEEVSHRAS